MYMYVPCTYPHPTVRATSPLASSLQFILYFFSVLYPANGSVYIIKDQFYFDLEMQWTITSTHSNVYSQLSGNYIIVNDIY